MVGKDLLKLSRAGVLIGAALLGLAAMGSGDAARGPVVKVDSGQLQGVVDDGVVSYKGIPFAAPPVGELRWRPPQPVARWAGVRQAAEFGADCMQGRFGPPPTPGAPQAAPVPSEDCLYLNVWSPERAEPGAKLPVMVWIYGGGFTGGSSSSPNTSGTQFAKHGVVMVAANYRVGRFGFFAFPALSRERPDETKGNYAYMDQIAALQWIKRNIAAFGGDPNHVTIFGFSAGGVSVHSLIASPMARGLFQKAIIESGGSRDSVLTARPTRADGVDPNYPVSAETIGINFARSMGVEGTDQSALARLRPSAPSRSFAARRPNRGLTPRTTRRRPSLTGSWSRRRPRPPIKRSTSHVFRSCLEATAPIPPVTGYGPPRRSSCSPDSDNGALRRRRPTIQTARPIWPRWYREQTTTSGRPSRPASPRMPSQPTGRPSIDTGSPTFRLRCGNGCGRGLRTGGEIAFVFGTLTARPGSTLSPEDLAVSRMAQSYWVNFAKTGDPNGAGLPPWPRHDPNKDLIFEFRSDGSAGAGTDAWKARCDVMKLATESGKRADF